MFIILFSILFASAIDSQSSEEKSIASIPFIQPASAQQSPTPPGYIEQKPYSGDCGARPSGTVCIGYSDGYTWLVSDSIQGWEDIQEDGKNVQVAVGFNARYYHILNPNLVKTGSLITQAAPEPAPKPILSFTTTKEYEAGGNDFIQYNLTVDNWQSYPQYLFDKAPHLPPCGLNENAARTWVDIFNGKTGARIYGFCALSSPNDLTKLWFAVSATSTPPQSVYVKLIDRQEGVTYTSNIVTITEPEPEPEPAPSYIEQKPYSGNCKLRPSGTVCIGYSDGYTWLVSDSIQGWEDVQEDGKNVQVAVGFNARYYHTLNPNLVKTGPPITQAAPEPAPPPSISEEPLSTEITLDYIEQKSYRGDCDERPSGTVCIAYSDGYTWLVYDSIQGWENIQEDGKNVQVAVGNYARYYHMLNPNLVGIGPPEPERNLEPRYFELKSYSKDCLERKLGTVCIGYSDGYTWLVSDSVRDWDEIQVDGKSVEVAVGNDARYYHILNPNLVKTGSLITQAAPDPAPAPEPAPEPAPSLKSVIGETAVYEEYGFYIEYPPDWEIVDEWTEIPSKVFFKGDYLGKTGISVSLADKYEVVEGYEKKFIKISNVDQSLLEIVTKNEQEACRFNRDGPCWDFKLLDSKIIIMGEEKSISVKYSAHLDDEDTIIRIILLPDDENYWFIMGKALGKETDFGIIEMSMQSFDLESIPVEIESSELALTLGTDVSIPQGTSVPGWIKNTAKWWAAGQIGDSDFVGGIQHLLKEKIIDIPDLPEQSSETAEEQVPDWVRNNAKWWADGQISEDDFVNGIKYLVEQGIIQVN